MKKSSKNLVLALILILASITGLWLEYDEQRSYDSQSISTNSPAEENQENTEEKININTASAEKLQSLYGIGKAMSERIVNYRTKHGNFETIQDIMKVNGISQKMFDRIKDYITVN